MLSPSDFNNAVPQFTNGNYASNPINPQYIAEPDAESYNRGTEPLQTLPAQWWNWFINKFTARFNKVNIYVKNIFNELAQVLSIFNITPDGTEQTPTTSQLKTVFETCYPQYVKTQTTGTAVGCIPTVGTALGTTNNNILVTDSTGKLKPSGITVGTAAGCDATLFARKTEVDALYGNVVGTPLGTAAVGTCTTFARSDHVHSSHVCTTVTIDAPGTGSWDEGLRINRAPSGWALLNIGGLANSINGCNGAFTISCYEPEGTKLFVAWQGSCASSYFEPEGNAGAVKWHGNVCGVASCAGHAEYATSAGTAASAGTAGTASCLAGFETNNNVPKDANCVTYNAITYYTSNGPIIAQEASVNDGALYSQAWSDVWVGQIAQDYRNGRLFVRGRNNGTWMPWLNIIDSGNIGSQSVNYATSAGLATCANQLYAVNAGYTTWRWDSQIGGQPNYLWGSNDGTTMYVWSPATLNVNCASCAGETQRLKSFHLSDNQSMGTYYYYENGRTCMYSNVTILYWIDTYATASAQILQGGNAIQISTYEEANPEISFARLN